MKHRIDEILNEARSEIKDITGPKQIDDLKIKYLGRNGLLTEVLKSMGKLSPEDRPVIGKLANQAKIEIQELLDNYKLDTGQVGTKDYFDISLARKIYSLGNLHPVTKIKRDIVKIFRSAGFSVMLGPEVEIDYYNFEALNMPAEHPARDMQDTFYVKGGCLLRTHTSAVQVRVMEKQSPPVLIIVPGKVYRRDDDISHIPMFQQVEGLLIDEKTNFGHLKGVLTYFIKNMFGKDTKIRFRPSFFPYTEPSAEIDIQCVICKGKGCRTCSGSGWLEILGSGMVDPAVFDSVKYDYEKYQGYAFGMGIERIAMLKYGINDIRLFYGNDIRFLNQF